jgi:hypothetical protein
MSQLDPKSIHGSAHHQAAGHRPDLHPCHTDGMPADLDRRHHTRKKSFGSNHHLLEVSAEAKAMDSLAMCRLLRLSQGVHSSSITADLGSYKSSPHTTAGSTQLHPEPHAASAAAPSAAGAASVAGPSGSAVPAVSISGGADGPSPFAAVDVQRHRTVSWSHELVSVAARTQQQQSQPHPPPGPLDEAGGSITEQEDTLAQAVEVWTLPDS